MGVAEELSYQELVNQGIVLMQVENYIKARDFFAEAIRLDPEKKDAYFHLGNANANLEMFDEALYAFKKVVELDPSDGEAYFDIGNVYVLKDDTAKCVENYNLAEANGFNRVELYTNLAGIYMQLDETLQAIRTLSKAIKVEPLRADLRIEKAKMYITASKYDEALDTLEELRRLFPDAFEAYDLQTQILCGLKQYDKAKDIITDAVERFEDDVVLRWIKVKVLVEMGDYQQAKEEIAAVEKMDGYESISREVAIQEAILHSGQNDLPAAIRALEKALKREKENVDEQCRYMLMNLLYSGKDYQKALEHAEKLASLDRSTLYSISGKYCAAHIQKIMGQTDAANDRFKELRTEFRKQSIQEPTFYELYMYRLLCHMEIGEFDKALQLADYIENLFPDRSDAYALRSLVYTNMGKMAEAAEQRQKAKELNPNLNM